MGRLSIILPSRDEKFLLPTIHDIFRNAHGEVEVVTVLDSNQWPAGWKEVTDQYPNLHTIHNGKSIGMRGSINAGVASAVSRGAGFIAKFDAHCSFSEGFDEVLKAECDKDWVVVPRRGRLDPENWCETELTKPPIDYHYLSFPDDPNDFGGPGLNGKVWAERAVQRRDILLDEEMSSQGSGWFMHADYFQQLELMDEASYGGFWSEFQEIGLKCWLSGGKVMVNKKAKYLHLHKGRTHGRGYKLDERWLTQGRNHTMKWLFNEAWNKQTLPFSWLIEHFAPVPTWPENWEEVLYATRKPRVIVAGGSKEPIGPMAARGSGASGLTIISATYGVDDARSIDVRERIEALVVDNSLDLVVNNSTLTPGENPFRGQKKRLLVRYSIDGGEVVEVARDEKDWFIIGPVAMTQAVREAEEFIEDTRAKVDELRHLSSYSGNRMIDAVVQLGPPRTPAALNDYLIRKFSISPQRLRGPMPIELRDFHRNDLAQLFAELGFKRGAEIGVAEGNYSEVLKQANPACELFLVDRWHHYSENPQGKSKERHEFAYNEMLRKMKPYKNVFIIKDYSLNAVETIAKESLDYCYVDANHLFDECVMDLIQWSKRVRSGGIVSGDDFYQLDQKRWVGGGVVEAVQAYVNAHRIPIWYLFQGHKSVDYFWCKP